MRCTAKAQNRQEKIIWVQTESKVCMLYAVSSTNLGLLYRIGASTNGLRNMVGPLSHVHSNTLILQDVLTAALEAGLSTVVFSTASVGLVEEWSQIGRFTALTVSVEGEIFDSSKKVRSCCIERILLTLRKTSLPDTSISLHCTCMPVLSALWTPRGASLQMLCSKTCM